jgi:hypothetical protein
MSRLRRLGAWCAVAVLAGVVAACDRSAYVIPREYGPVVLGAGDRCPALAGRYFDSSDPIRDLLFLAHVLDAPQDADRAWIELAGMADTGLAVTVVYRDSARRYGSLRRGTPFAGDYFCEGGWLKISDHRIPKRWDRDLTEADFYPRRRAFWVAPNADSALVGRLQFIHFRQLDAGRGVPVPGTFKSRDTWSLAEKYDPDLPPPVARQREEERERLLADLERARRDPVYQENDLLENGPPDAERETVRQRALLSLVDGVLLRGVGRQPDGFHLSVEFEELWQLDQFMERLRGSGPVEALHIAPLSRSRTTRGRWADVVFVRYGS